MRYFSDLLPALAADGRPWEIFWETKANLSRAQVATLRAAGVTTIQAGIESLSDRVLKLMRKGTSGLRNVQLLKWCREQEVAVGWHLLYGFPGETRQDYEHMFAMLPAIEFLHPPRSFGRIRMDRFSPYFDNPQEFGLTNIRPGAAYRFLYPFPPESVMRIAYHFHFDYPPGAAPIDHAEEVIRFAKAWSDKNEEGALWSVVRPGGSLVLHDTRACATTSELELRGHEAAAYDFCDEFRPLPAIVRHLRERSAEEDICEDRVRAFLQGLAAKHLMVTDGHNWLSLALRPAQARSSKAL
jgi:ribosomal peptide maturation radical SAM protein 1